MKKSEDIPKITVPPKTGSDKPARSQSKTEPIDKTVRITDDLPRSQTKIDDAPTTSFRWEPLDNLYAILDKVGDGGMGIVYLGQDRKLGRYAAIKRLNSTGLRNPVLKERFFREAKSVAALNHIHIVHVYALGEDSEGPYIVMEYVPGPPEESPDKVPHTPFSLADRVEKSGPLSLDDALSLILKICRAIEYAHNCGVIHRDLKPSNVLLDESGEPKLVDFGLARRLDAEDDQLTVPGEKMLSVGYGAPEQEMDASRTDQRADVYGLGGILYFSITGKNPRYFRESEVPETLRMPLVKALETDRNKRWNTVKEFTTALLMIKSPSTIELPTVKTTWRCKWCDTINPVTISYCGKCGWDGGESCAECGADTRVGIQFCGSCGADAREYEMANLLYKRMQHHWEEKSFELVAHEAARAVRFQPAGPSGRNLLNRIHSLGKDAQRAINRRTEIKDLISRELAAQNYDLVKKYVEEYATLSSDNAYADLTKELPSLIMNGNLKKVRKAVDQREWDYAQRTCKDIIASNPAGNPEAEFLLRIIRYHRIRTRVLGVAAAAVTLFLFYVLSAPPMYRFLGQLPDSGYRPMYDAVDFIHDSTIFQGALDKYAKIWGVPGMFEKKPEKESLVLPSKSGDLPTLLAEFEAELKKIETQDAARVQIWQQNYEKELAALQQMMQKKGDFEGWNAVRNEMQRLDDSPSIPDDAVVAVPQELSALQAKFRDLETKQLAEKKKDVREKNKQHMTKLENLQKRMTMQGKMDSAAAVNAEIKRIKAVLDSEPQDPLAIIKKEILPQSMQGHTKNTDSPK